MAGDPDNDSLTERDLRPCVCGQDAPAPVGPTHRSKFVYLECLNCERTVSANGEQEAFDLWSRAMRDDHDEVHL